MNKFFNKPAKIFDTHNLMYGHIMQSNISSDHVFCMI